MIYQRLREFLENLHCGYGKVSASSSFSDEVRMPACSCLGESKYNRDFDIGGDVEQSGFIACCGDTLYPLWDWKLEAVYWDSRACSSC
jgi:hypothetical protein